MTMETPALVALGANLGDPLAALRRARQALSATPGVRVTGASRLYRTAPVGGPPGQPDYLNAVLRLDTRLDAPALLTVLRSLEAAAGRVRAETWGPRTLDLDLLDWGGRVCDGPELTLPHPRLHQRAFVLVPLAEVAPGWRHPRLGRTAGQLLAELFSTAGVIDSGATW